jgi:hypothetical protein
VHKNTNAVVKNLATSMKYSCFQSTKSLDVMGGLAVLVLLLLLAITYVSSVSMGVSLQEQLNLSAIKHAQGHKMPVVGPDIKMEIYPCDDTHECATSI